MARLSLKWFGGMIPRRGEQHLPAPHATEAENVNLYSGELRPLKKPARAHEFCRPEDECWNTPLVDDPSFPPTLPECPPGGEKPEITQEPESVNSIPGGTVTLTVVAEGTEPLIYQWFEDGIAIPSAVNPTYEYTAGQADDIRYFSVAVYGPCGEALSNVVTVNTSLSNEPCDVYMSALQGIPDLYGLWPHDERASSSRSWDHSNNGRKIAGGSFQAQAESPASPMKDCRTALVIRGTNSGRQFQSVDAGSEGGRAAEAFRDAWTWGAWIKGSEFIPWSDSNQYFWVCSGHNLQDYGRVYWDSGDGRLRARKEGHNNGAAPVNAEVFTASSDPGFMDLEGADKNEWHHYMVTWGRTDGSNGLGGAVSFYKDFQLHKSVTDGRTSRSCLIPNRQIELAFYGKFDSSSVTAEPTCSMAYTMIIPRKLNGTEIGFLRSEYERQQGDIGIGVTNFWVEGPDDYYVDAGEIITFDVNAPAGVEPQTFQWYTESGAIIPGEATDKLTLTAGPTTEGRYYCVVSDAQGVNRKSKLSFLKVNYNVPPTNQYTDFVKSWLEARVLNGQGLCAYWPMNDQPLTGGPINDVLDTAAPPFPLDGGTITNQNVWGPLNETDFYGVDVRGQNSGKRSMWNEQTNCIGFRNDMTFGCFIRRRNADWNDGQNGTQQDTMFSCFPVGNNLTPGFDDFPVRNNELRFMVNFWNNSSDPDVDTDEGRVGMQTEIWEQINEAEPEDPPELHWRNTGLETKWTRVNSQDDEWHHVMVHFFSDVPGENTGRYKIWWDFQLVVDNNGIQGGLANPLPGTDWRVQLFASENNDEFIGELDGRMSHAFIMQGFPNTSEVDALKAAFDANNTVRKLDPTS